MTGSSGGSILVEQVRLLMLVNTAECISHHMQQTYSIPGTFNGNHKGEIPGKFLFPEI